MKRQVVIIHGGDAFETYEQYISFLKDQELNFEKLKVVGWKAALKDRLGEDFEVILPNMPNSWNARYKEWKIWFGKLIPFLEQDVVLVGHSLGGIFLAKYLSENTFPRKILGTFLIAAPYDDKDSGESLVDFVLSKSFEKLIEQGGKIHLYHSKDDPVVPFADFEKYRRSLPQAEGRVFEEREHFTQTEFPELVEDIRKLY